MTARKDAAPYPAWLLGAEVVSVAHYQPILSAWMPETTGAKGAAELWTTDPGTAQRLAEGYRSQGYLARIIPASVRVQEDRFHGATIPPNMVEYLETQGILPTI